MVTDYASAISRKTILPAATLVLLALAVIPSPLLAQGRVFWQEGGVVLCESTAAIGLCAVSDGSGGAIAAWADSRGSHESVWARRVDGDGSPLWQADGVLLRGGTWSPMNLSACSDLEGGMIACWTESYAGPYAAQVTAQRVDTSGAVRWGPTGMVVAGSDGDRDYDASIVSDGRGGAIVVWLRKQLGPQSWLDSLCIQRLDSLGRFCWGPAGVLVSADTLLWTSPYLCSDRHGGAYTVWLRSEGSTLVAHVQHFDSSGLPSWGQGGVPVCSTNTSIVSGLGVTETDSGCVVAFAKGVGGSEGIWAQRLSSSGGMLWGPHGTCVGSSGGLVWDFEILAAEPRGFFCAWSEKRHDTYDILAQRLGADGVRLWDTAGVEVGTIGSGEGHGFSVESGGRGDLIAAWPTLRMGDWGTIAQRIDSDGCLRWGDSGLAVTRDTLMQYWEPALTTDDREGAVVFWEYSFATPQGYKVGIKAQRIGDGTAITRNGTPVVQTAVCRVQPNPARGQVCIWTSSPEREVTIEIVSATGAVVRRLVATTERREPLIWNCRDDRGGEVPAGVYYCRNLSSGKAAAKLILSPR